MRYGITLPPFGALAEPAYLTELAQAAEAAGWDGFFLWDTVIHDDNFYPIADPWIALGGHRRGDHAHPLRRHAHAADTPPSVASRTPGPHARPAFAGTRGLWCGVRRRDG